VLACPLLRLELWTISFRDRVNYWEWGLFPHCDAARGSEAKPLASLDSVGAEGTGPGGFVACWVISGNI